MHRLVALVLVGTLLAGCTDEPAPAENDDGPTLVTDPRDLEGGNSSGEHLHDYWGGQDRLTLHEEETSGGGLISTCNGFSWYVFQPDTDHTVIQGTEFVEITMDWQDEPTDHYSDPELWIRTAEDDAPHFVSAVEPGQTVVFETNNTANDLPHQQLSSWEFHWVLYPGEEADPNCNLWFHGDMTFRSEIVRGLEIPLYPGHPDRWDNATMLPVLDESKSVFLDQGTDEGGNGLCLSGGGEDGGCFWENHRPSGGAVVPHDARTVEVRIVPANTGPFDIQFAYHDAATREMTTMDPTREDGDTRIYVIDVGSGGDGPYAKQSLWEFRVYPDQQTATYVEGGYAITVETFKQ